LWYYVLLPAEALSTLTEAERVSK